MRRAIRSRGPKVLLALAGWLGGAALAAAGTGAQFVLPPVGVQPPPTSGLQLKVETDWVQGYGHRPVRVELIASTGSGIAREVTVELGLSDWSSHNYVTVAVKLQLPDGTGGARVSKVVPVPQLSSAQSLHVRTLEQGRQIDELSTSLPIFNGQYHGGDSGVPRVLFVGASVPDVRQFAFLGATPYLSYGNTINFRQLADVFAFAHRTPDNLYDEWLFYSGIDLMFLSLDDARELAKKRPVVWRAIGDWNRCGGTLCVYGAGGDWSRLAEIEQLLDCPASEREAKLPQRGWEAPTELVFENYVVPAMQAAALAEAAEEATDGVVQMPFAVAPKVPDKPPFVWRTAALGRVVALAASQPFPGESANWRWLLASFDTPSNAVSTRWTSRIGSVPDGENPHFNEFLIGDVGMPPIRTYRVLITVFIVAIGPLNYWLLRRYGRLHLFLFTVPLAALVTSAGLLTYALMSDGLVSRLRARSLTHLDQRSGTSTSAARLSYYVGLAPSQGLTFPRDTLVVPLELTPSTTNGDYRQRRLTWGDAQYLTRGWLGSRTPTQYVTLRAEHSERGLDVTSDGTRLVITNRLGTPIRDLIVCDEAGVWHSAGEVEIDRQVRLAVLASAEEFSAAGRRLVKIFNDLAPAFPDAMSAYGTHENWLWFGRRNRYYQNVSIDSSVNVLDAGLSRLRAEIRAHALAPRSYVAIVERPPSIVTGTEGLTETQGLHVIQGTW